MTKDPEVSVKRSRKNRIAPTFSMLPSLEPTDLSNACNVRTYSPASSGDLCNASCHEKRLITERTGRSRNSRHQVSVIAGREAELQKNV